MIDILKRIAIWHRVEAACIAVVWATGQGGEQGKTSRGNQWTYVEIPTARTEFSGLIEPPRDPHQDRDRYRNFGEVLRRKIFYFYAYMQVYKAVSSMCKRKRWPRVCRCRSGCSATSLSVLARHGKRTSGKGPAADFIHHDLRDFIMYHCDTVAEAALHPSIKETAQP